ncbi:MAG: hypothetical protein J2P48_10035, partial [Alphaproteobacteria bacterium]|nr:hypothetical protein [Alphaproteobacteria bacterium]
MPRPVIAALYVAFVLLFALVLRWRGGAPWRQFFFGAAAIFVAGNVGGLVYAFIVFISALFMMPIPNALVLLRTHEPWGHFAHSLILLMLVAATGEEVLRCAFLWRNRQMPVWHAAMFG